MWLEESMNNLCDTIPKSDWDNKLALVYKNNSENLVAVKTPFGLTERVVIKDIVTQGGVWGPIQCSNQMDGVGKECLNRNIHLYNYKGCVKVLPLAMIDDVLAIAKCGIDSFAINTFINAKIEMNKLLFSEPKCKHLHSGKCNPFCPALEVHGETIEKSTEEKYLGDLIGDTIMGDGSNKKNIIKRKAKGIGIVSQIMVIMETVSLGFFVFEIAMILRESLSLNGMMFNCEVWYGLTKAQVLELAAVDKLLLRRILGVPISTPTESMYLELGIVPIEFVLMGRRAMFLHYILNLDETEMLSLFFFAQWRSPCKNDWTETVKKDLAALGIALPLQAIRIHSREQFKTLVATKCREAAFKHLMDLKTSHSKMASLDYEELKIQPYFVDKTINSNDAKLLFKFRTRMVRVKRNYRNNLTDLNCPLCESDEDTQQHLLLCPRIHTTTGLPAVNYMDIYSGDIVLMKKTIDSLKKALWKREELLNLQEQAELL
jgi:hypothetical protein